MSERWPVLASQACCLYCVLLLVIIAGCSHSCASPPDTQATEYDIDGLVFEPAELKQSFQSYTAVARRFCSNGFQQRPFRAGGNSIRAEWFKGAESRTEIFFPKGVPPNADIHRVVVQARCLPPPRREEQAVDPARPEPIARESLIAVTFVPSDPDEWCTTWGYTHLASSQGGTHVDWHIRFCRWNVALLKQVVPFRPLENVREDVSIPLRHYLGVDRRWGVAFNRAEPRCEDFFRRMESADAMLEAQLADLDRLEAEVTRQLDEGLATKFVPGEPSAPKGVPPRGERVALSDDELAAERTHVKAYFSAQRTVMQEHSAAMYATFRKSFPLEECLPELAAPSGR